MRTVAAGVCPANPGVRLPAISQIELGRIRIALVERIDAAAEKAKWGREPESGGMPSRLFAAGCFLAAHGFDDRQCEGERWFNTNFAAYRSFAAFADMIEMGRQAIYDGRNAIAPLPLMEKAA